MKCTVICHDIGVGLRHTTKLFVTLKTAYILTKQYMYIFISTSITYTNEHKYYGEKYQNGIKNGYVKANLAVKLAPWGKLVIRIH